MFNCTKYKHGESRAIKTNLRGIQIVCFKGIAEILGIEEPFSDERIKFGDNGATQRTTVKHGHNGNLTYSRAHIIVLDGTDSNEINAY